MKLVVVSDTHWDARTAGVPRFAEVDGAYRRAARHAIEVKADAFVHLGDSFDPDAGPVGYRALATIAECSLALGRVGIETLVLAGNHCVIEDSRVGIRSVVSPLCELGVRVFDEPGFFNLKGTLFLALPFTPSWAPYSPLDWAAKFVERTEGKRGVVLGHLDLEGVTAGSEASDFARGRDVFWPLDFLAPLSRKYLLLGGHIHRRQVYRGVHIVGSLCRLAFGEDEVSEPGFIEVDYP